MASYLPLLVNGILVGSLYGLIAQGLGLAVGVAKIINIAHGALLMVAMYLTFLLWKAGWNPWLAGVVVIPCLFGIGYLIEATLINRILRREQDREPVGVLIQTTGIMIVIESAAVILFSSDYRSIQTRERSVHLGSVLMPPSHLIGFAAASLVCLALYWLLQKTDLGRAMRAVGQDRDAAQLMGINVYHVYNMVLAVGAAAAAVAGLALSQFFYVYPLVGDIFLLRAFLIVAVGGAGNVVGAYTGGIIVGLIESIGSAVIDIAYIDGLIFFICVLVLLLRPKGLLSGID